MQIQIGKKIKELRKSKKLTLEGLSKKSGVQVATISRIENFKMVGTLDSHNKIAEALGINIIALYEDTTIPEPAEEQEISAPDSFTFNDKSSYEILTKNVMSKKMMPIILNIDVGGKTSEEQNRQGSERFIFILEGAIQVNIDNSQYDLKKNSSLYFDSSKKHWFKNIGNKAAKIISVVTPMAL